MLLSGIKPTLEGLICLIYSICDLDLNGKRVFIRVDFNVPLQKNEKGDMRRAPEGPLTFPNDFTG